MRMPSLYAGEHRSDRTNDCIVRAMSNLTLLDYLECEQILIPYGYRINKGIKEHGIVDAAPEFGLRHMCVFGKRDIYAPKLNKSKAKGISLGNFIKQYPKGKFLVPYSRHVVAVVDGNIIDTFDNNPKRRVIAAISFNSF